MSSVNKVILLGYLGRDPELRYTPSGMAVANFSLATSSGGGRDREQQTEWHRIVVFDKQAEVCNQYLSKGRQVYLEGRLQTRQWDDKQTGQKHSATEIVANQIVFVGAGTGTGGERKPPQTRQERVETQSPVANPAIGNWQTDGAGTDDDIPF